MKLNNTFKIAWWAALLLFLGVLFYKRFPYVMNAKADSFDYVIFTVFIVLALLPFFSQMEMFGFKLTKDIEAAKEEVKTEVKGVKDNVDNGIKEVKALINNISNNNSNNNNIYLSTPQPTLNNHQLEELRKNLNVTPSISIPKPEKIENRYLQDKDHVLPLFTIRYAIEHEIHRLITANPSIDSEIKNTSRNRQPNITRYLNILSDSNIITSEVSKALKEVYGITSVAIHGGGLQPNQIDFALTVGAQLVENLRETNYELVPS